MIYIEREWAERIRLRRSLLAAAAAAAAASSSYPPSLLSLARAQSSIAKEAAEKQAHAWK